MSSNTTSSDVAAAIAEASESAIASYCGIAGIVFLLYEFTITLGQEVDLFWTRRPSGATVLFLANKYLTLLNHIFDVTLFIPFRVSDQTYVCDLRAKAFSSLDYLQYVPWAAFSGLRAFALSKSWFLSASVLLLSLVPLGVNFSVPIYGVNDPVAGCGMVADYTQTIGRKQCRTTGPFAVKCYMLTSTADIILIFVTWYNLPRRGIPRMFRQGPLSFANVVLFDGTVYFLVLLVLNTLHMVFTFTGTSEFTYFTEPMTAVLVSRFLLDLQEINQRSVKAALGMEVDSVPQLSSTTVSQWQSIDFARVVGSLGDVITLETYTADSEVILRDELLEGQDV
ncbi:hypothetical protein C8Q80DRAFT_1275598 [Daedaleopsis nitida]|nr:hypothetical protein C8Q80DRAFT_1275598 [Daedaleopsis nitida]